MSDKLALARIKRLQKEMEKFETDPPPGCEASMTDPMTIKAKIKGVGPYDGGTYQFKITIPKVHKADDPLLGLKFFQRYPHDPPEVKLETRIYHPNFDKYGRVCLSIIKKGEWKPSMNIRTLLLSIQSIFSEPNAEDPLDADVAR